MKCTGCGAQTADVYLCQRCEDELTAILGRLPAWLNELDTTVTRQARVTARGGGKATKKFEQPLVYNVPAAELADMVGDKLGGWVLHYVEDEARATTAADCCRWLVDHIDVIRLDEYAGQTLAEVRAFERRITKLVDRPPDRIFVGPCGAMIPGDDWDCGCRCHGYGGTHRPDCDARYGDAGCGVDHLRQCDADLYIESPDQERVQCPNPSCETIHDVAERQAWLVEQAEDRIESPLTIARALTGFLDLTVTASSVRQMAFRHQIVPHGHQANGDPIYRVGDVVKVLEARAQRIGKKRAS